MIISLLVLDNCKETEFYVDGDSAYTFRGDPYSLGADSIDNKLFRNLWNIPFVTGGEFLKSSRYLNVEPDILLVVCEKSSPDLISEIRKNFPNTLIVSYIKEGYPGYYTSSFIEFARRADAVAYPFQKRHCDKLSSLVGKGVVELPIPYNVESIRSCFNTATKDKNIFAAFHPHLDRGKNPSIELLSRLGLENPKDPDFSWFDWMTEIKRSRFVVNLDLQNRFGQVAIECGILGSLHIGGISDSSQRLFNSTAHNDIDALYNFIVNCSDDDYEKIVTDATKNVEAIYSYEAFKRNVEGLND